MYIWISRARVAYYYTGTNTHVRKLAWRGVGSQEAGSWHLSTDGADISGSREVEMRSP